MYISMKEINFIPIFDQTAPGVWDDFMRIRVAAMRENYGHDMSATDYAHYMRQYQDDFARHQYNVAYGAYENLKDKLSGKTVVVSTASPFKFIETVDEIFNTNKEGFLLKNFVVLF